MTRYLVLSGRLAGLEEGNTIGEDQLPPGTNVSALVASGHLAAITEPAPADDGVEEEDT